MDYQSKNEGLIEGVANKLELMVPHYKERLRVFRDMFIGPYILPLSFDIGRRMDEPLIWTEDDKFLENRINGREYPQRPSIEILLEDFTLTDREKRKDFYDRKKDIESELGKTREEFFKETGVDLYKQGLLFETLVLLGVQGFVYHHNPKLLLVPLITNTIAALVQAGRLKYKEIYEKED